MLKPWFRKFTFQQMLWVGWVFITVFTLNWVAHLDGLATPLNSLKSTVEQQLHGNELHFVAMGDTGSGAPMQFKVAKALEAHHKQTPFQFVTILGDIIYPTGNAKQYGQSRYQTVYQPLMDLGVKFYGVLGNHDYMTADALPVMQLMNMSARYYQFEGKSPDGTKLADFFVIDTIKYTAEQQAWLKAALQKSKAPWKIVLGHYPIYSSGLHGTSKTLKQQLQPVLEANKVDLYLAGHDHNYERFQKLNGVTYVVTGGGGAYTRKFAPKAEAGSLKRLSTHHFLSLTLEGKTLIVKALNADNQIIDEFTLNH